MAKNEHEGRLEQIAVTNRMPTADRGQNDALATQLQHSTYRPPEGFDAVPPPIHRASTVLFPDTGAMRSREWRERTGYTYGLHGTPTTFTLERRLADIEGARHCVLCPSGLAAIALVNLALLQQGDSVLVPANGYGPGVELAERMLARFGIQACRYDPLDPGSVVALATPSTRLLWLEAPGSVTMEMPDLRALVGQARTLGLVTAIDNTWSAGIALKPFELGIDISMQALTKYQSGGADVLMGAVLTRDASLYARLSDAHMWTGQGVGGDDAGLVLRGLHSLALRYAAQDAAGRRIAQWLMSRPEVGRVFHPALEGSPGHAFWARDCVGAAGLLGFTFRGDVAPADVDAFVDALRLFGIGYSWGGPTSLAVPYDVGAMRGRTWRDAPTLVRLAIGLEDVDDLIADLAQAFTRAHRSFDAPRV